MRGIEGALHVLHEVREGRFAPESLRRAGKEMKPEDLSLASSLVYIALRRQELWRNIFSGFVKSGGNKNKNKGKAKEAEKENKGNKKEDQLPPQVQDCLLAGTAGLLELRHFSGGVLVNALLDCLKEKKQNHWVPLVNAVLHNVGERGAERIEALRRSPSLEDRALCAGVPVWFLPAWERTWERPELSKLFELLPRQPASCLRVSPGQEDRLMELLKARDMEARPSELYELSGALHLNSTVLPANLPGFNEGLCTVQSESSILAASLVRRFYKGGLILDMCSGRGVKAGQVLQACPDARLECWELSEGRHRSALREIQRLGLEDRVTFRHGNALELEPEQPPSFVLLDAPCSGSGTWNRKPESKWRLNWEKFDRLVSAQRNLLERAVSLCAPHGVILYITCSLLRQENENVVAGVLADHQECVGFPVPWTQEAASRVRPFHRGRPWGMYIWPETPWLDGFYCALIMKR